MRSHLVVPLLSLAVVALAFPAHASERRLALVIGNQAYPRAPLANPRNDATAVAAVLERLGFSVTRGTDLSRRQTRETVSAYLSALNDGDQSFVYYSGHGIQVKGENYLVPIDFAAEAESDVEDEAYRVGRLLDGLADRKPRLSVVVLDACRDNPFKTTRSGTRGLSGMNAGEGTLIAFATSPGRTAEDGPPGGHGLFTASLLDHLARPGLEVEALFKSIREEVAERSQMTQVPWSSTSIVGIFYLAGPSAPPIPSESPVGKLLAQADVRRQGREEAASRAAQEATRAEDRAGEATQVAAVLPAEREARYQKALEDEFDRLEKLDAYSTADVSASEKAAAWADFVSSFPYRNVHADQADSRSSYWRDQVRLASIAASSAANTSGSDAPMVVIPAGHFTMGAEDGDADEQPPHLVMLSAFSIDQTEVTVSAYARCVEAGTCTKPKDWSLCNFGKGGRDHHPINCVTWADADRYCRWAGKRLPTEAEWEYAARASDGRRFPWGNPPPNCDRAVMPTLQLGPGCGTDSTWPVGSKKAGASPWGLSDMAGNVAEWVADRYSDVYYKSAPQQDPQGPSSGSDRVLRGGGWKDSRPSYLRSSYRYGAAPVVSADDTGFRCARSP